GIEQLHAIAQVREVGCHEPRDLTLCPRHRWDVHQVARQRHEVDHGATAAAWSRSTPCRSNSASWSRSTASRTRASSTTKVRLTREAPCEMSETLMSETVANTRAAIPGVVRRPSPTTQKMARPDSTDTLLIARNSAALSVNGCTVYTR